MILQALLLAERDCIVLGLERYPDLRVRIAGTVPAGQRIGAQRFATFELELWQLDRMIETFKGHLKFERPTLSWSVILNRARLSRPRLEAKIPSRGLQAGRFDPKAPERVL